MNVSIVNWVKQPAEPPDHALLDGVGVEGITPALMARGLDVSGAFRLSPNRGHAFQGPIPAGEGFLLSAQEAKGVLGRSEADYSDVVRPYLIGDDIATEPSQEPGRWIIDFGFMPLEQAERYPAALEIVRERVKPARDQNRDPGFREKWWRFGRPRREMRDALQDLTRYIAGNAQGKRILFAWQRAYTCPSNLTNVFAFDDDFSMGLLSSAIHHEWARAQSSTLRIDFRYTPTTAFETMPWPAPSDAQRDQVAELARNVIEQRQTICQDRQIGLTTLYNEIDEGAYADLRQLHAELDKSVAVAYGWPASAASDPVETNRRLLELNERIAAGEVEYSPF